MIVLDTHIWVWWVGQSPQLSPAAEAYIRAEEPNGLGVSAISCWEVALLVEKGRLGLTVPLPVWFRQALSPPRVQLLPLTPEVTVEMISQPGTFHRDPADRVIVATARLLDCPVVTEDGLIRAYPHVRVAP